MNIVLTAILFFIPSFFFAQLTTSEWTVQIGGYGDQEGNDLVYDDDGNVYVVGIFFDTVDFDPGPAENILISSASNSAFVAKYDSAGNYIWAKHFDGDGNETALTVGVDDSLNVYVGGYFYGSTIDVDPGPGSTIFNSFGDGDMFLVKLSSGGDLVWAKQLGSNGADYLSTLCLDESANVYCTGHFQFTADFDPGSGSTLLTGGGAFNSSMFVLKLDSAANFIWVDQITATDWVSGYSMSLSDSLIYIGGDLDGTADFDPGPGNFDITATGLESIFVLKLDTSGVFYNAISIASTNVLQNYGIEVDTTLGVFISGVISGAADFDPFTSSGDYDDADMAGDFYIVNYDDNLNFQWLYGGGSNSTCVAMAVAVDTSFNIYSTGYFQQAVDFDYGIGTQLISSDSGSIFLLKLDQFGNFINVDQIGTGGFEEGRSLDLDYYGEIAMTGRFYGATDLGIKAPITTVDSYADAFVHKRSKAYLNIPEQNIKQSMFVYPNPTNGVINFSLKDYSVIEITNLMGQVVYATSLEAGSSSLNIEFLPDGIYSFRILSENENRCVQVIKN